MSWDVASLQKQAKDAFDAWGGEQELRRLFPSMPTMSGPRPVVIKPPDQTLRDFEVNDGLRPAFKGRDLPKNKLDSEPTRPSWVARLFRAFGL